MVAKTTILSVSLPPRLRQRLDREARRQRRSRSFIVAEAIEQYLGGRKSRQFDDARKRTLLDALARSPAERLRLSEELWQELAAGRGLTTPWTAGFDTFEEYEGWRRRGGAPAG